MVIKNYYDSKIKNTFIGLIVSFCLNEKIDNFSIDEKAYVGICNLAKFHSLEYLIYSSLEFNGIKLKDNEKKNKSSLLYKCITQMSELDNIKYKLNEEHIYHIPLKGSIIRTFYPDPAAREMADLDILVHRNEMKRMRKIMTKELGYQAVALTSNSPHDSFMKKPFMEVEIHRKLMVDYSKVASYLSKSFDRCSSEEGNPYTYLLKDNDFYIYNIMHNVKHFSKGGTGFRIFIDLFYSFKKIKYDFDYITNELKQFDLDTYNDRLISITNKLFSCLDLDSDEAFLLDYFICAGTYGTIDNDIVSNVLVNNQEEDNLDKNRKKYLWVRLFPPLSVMRDRNPSLNKAPFLLPWFWFTRICKGALKFRTYKAQASRINSVDDDDLETRKRVKDITNIDPYDW